MSWRWRDASSLNHADMDGKQQGGANTTVSLSSGVVNRSHLVWSANCLRSGFHEAVAKGRRTGLTFRTMCAADTTSFCVLVLSPSCGEHRSSKLRRNIATTSGLKYSRVHDCRSAAFSKFATDSHYAAISASAAAVSSVPSRRCRSSACVSVAARTSGTTAAPPAGQGGRIEVVCGQASAARKPIHTATILVLFTVKFIKLALGSVDFKIWGGLIACLIDAGNTESTPRIGYLFRSGWSFRKVSTMLCSWQLERRCRTSVRHMGQISPYCGISASEPPPPPRPALPPRPELPPRLPGRPLRPPRPRRLPPPWSRPPW